MQKRTLIFYSKNVKGPQIARLDVVTEIERLVTMQKARNTYYNMYENIYAHGFNTVSQGITDKKDNR